MFQSIEEIYNAMGQDDNATLKQDALFLLTLRDWYINVCEFDPGTGLPLPMGMTTLLNRIRTKGKTREEKVYKDRFSRIIGHSEGSLRSIIKKPRDKVLREHKMVPLYAAREVDSTSVQWLSRQPGKTVRDKLAGRPYLKAVTRRMCIDTSENRLLKAFLQRLEQTILIKTDTLGKTVEQQDVDLLLYIQRWLRSDEALDIGLWGNLPPNNTLLQDRNYRRIWDAWLWMQALDDWIREDSLRLHRDWRTVLFWTITSWLDELVRVRLLEQPCYFDDEKFHIDIKTAMKHVYGVISGSGNQPITLSYEINSRIIIETAHKKTVIEEVENNCSRVILESGHSRKTSKFECSWTSVQKITKQVIEFIFDKSEQKLEKHSKTNKFLPNVVSNVVIDLCATYPRFTDSNGKEQKFPFRLARQYWESGSERTSVNLDESRAVTIQPGIKTISILSLFSEAWKYDPELLSDAAMAFIEKIHGFLGKSSLTYLVPDALSEFSLERIRRNINHYFNDSQPLPRSIAAVFSWQSTKDFQRVEFREGDCVVVIDNVDEGISITPIVGYWSQEISDKVPVSCGIFWEHHPSVIVPFVKSSDVVSRVLSRHGFTIAAEIAELFGFDGVIDEAGVLSCMDSNGRWHNIPTNIKEDLVVAFNHNKVQIEEINEVIPWYELSKNPSIYLLPIGENIQRPEESIYEWLGSGWSLTRGGQILNSWQQQVGEVALWYDHLPELSIRVTSDGRPINFNLVMDKTITPQKGKKEPIEVIELFKLPAGFPHYKFPLVQGKAGRELHYVAFLKSPAFPLAEDTVCRLNLTYTYGATDPYELKFIPLNNEKAGFASVRVEWKNEEPEAPLICPAYPPKCDWADFQRYPKENGEVHNLLEWLVATMEKIRMIERFYSGAAPDVKDRIIADMEGADWFRDKNGEWCCKLLTEWGIVFIHQNEYEDFDTEANKISFNLVKRNVGFAARDISLGASLPKDAVDRLRRNIRFPVRTVWNDAHSLSEPEVPDWFRTAMYEGIQNTLSLMELVDDPELYDELFFFTCCLQKDAPAEVLKLLDSFSSETSKYKKYYRNLAVAIGDASLQWQKDLFKKIVSLVDSYVGPYCLRALSIALWRDEGLVYKLSALEISQILDNLIRRLNNEIDDGRIKGCRDEAIPAYVAIYLELLLALLRIRNSEDEKIRQLLSPRQDVTKKFVAIIDKLTDQICDANLKINSRISLQIKKPDAYHNTPDLLYALRMYLTGDTGAGAIQVTGVSPE